ncbi:TPA: methyltransferase domain-containing protein [Enterobacter asburiae]|uniref:methyltransferase domain-containing protein n=1 Tax=Enterobacter sp. EC_64 TaxID=2584092 RepID=UPI001C7063A0|nr:methyltransferase domain-containing protein [Enterobacter sp. EC_64]MBW9384856.1 methyltransferase domain-containing protein [Enterobacter sp. EC_64]
MTYQTQSIETLVENLPEVYQPIFNHPEFTAQASRGCRDRLEKIAAAYDYISREKGRPLKVLDLGCAQGFFSLNLAKRGAVVTAVDYSQPNINVCHKLAEENPAFKVEFLLGSIEPVIQEKISNHEYDMVLGLSVFHHLIYEHGSEFVFGLFKTLAQKVETGIFEFALNSEPLHWADAQPDDPRKLIGDYTFSHQLSMYSTHLSAVERPLYFASNKYWHVDDLFGVIDRFSDRSHQLDNFYHGHSRRYYFSGENIIKIFLTSHNNTLNHAELANESALLGKTVAGFRSAKLLSYGSTEGESWLAREAISGRLLLDMIIAGEDYDDEQIIAGILEQVTALENGGLYHNDLRPWNILIGDDGLVYIIDYGSISESTTDGDDLYGQILSFFVLIKEVAQHKIREPKSSRPRFIAPHDFPKKYHSWMSKVWMLPSQEWCFNAILAAYNNHDKVSGSVPLSSIVESYLSTMTNHMDWQVKQMQDRLDGKLSSLDESLRTEQRSTDAAFAEREKEQQQLSTKLDVLLEEHRSIGVAFAEREKEQQQLSTKLDALLEKMSAEMQMKAMLENSISKNDALRHELNQVYASKSWYLTYPLRLLSKFLQLVVHPRRFLSAAKSWVKKKIKGIFSFAMTFISNRPQLKQQVIRLLNRYPRFKYKIKRHLVERREANVYDTPVVMSIAVPHESQGSVGSEQPCLVKKNSRHEQQKSVLESWFY